MIHDSEFICPLCGLVLSSLAAFHRHVARDHESGSGSGSGSGQDDENAEPELRSGPAAYWVQKMRGT